MTSLLVFFAEESIAPAGAQALRDHVAHGRVTERDALRTLLTVRPPHPIPAVVERKLDAVLAREVAARAVVDARDLPTLPSADPG